MTVHTAWSGPNELVIKNTATLIDRENATTPSPTYISMISITNFQRTHSGLYYCTASVLFSFSKLSDGNCNTARIRIIVGKQAERKKRFYYKSAN